MTRIVAHADSRGDLAIVENEDGTLLLFERGVCVTLSGPNNREEEPFGSHPDDLIRDLTAGWGEIHNAYFKAR